MLTSDQIRAGRALVDWSQTQLALAAGISLPTVKRIEGKPGPGRSAAENLERVKRALEDAGVMFIDRGPYQGSGGPGVRLKKQED